MSGQENTKELGGYICLGHFQIIKHHFNGGVNAKFLLAPRGSVILPTKKMENRLNIGDFNTIVENTFPLNSNI